MCLLNGKPVDVAVKCVENRGVDGLKFMHTDIKCANHCLSILLTEWTVLRGVYAHSGKMDKTELAFNDVIIKEEYFLFVSN